MKNSQYVIYDKRVHRWRLRGKFISRAKAIEQIKKTKYKKFLVINKKGKIRVKQLRKKGKIESKIIKDSKLLSTSYGYKPPYKFMLEGNMNMYEIERYEKHIKKSLKYLYKRVKSKNSFFAVSLMLTTDKGIFYLSSNAYPKKLGFENLYLNIQMDIITKIEKICMKSSIFNVIGSDTTTRAIIRIDQKLVAEVV